MTKQKAGIGFLVTDSGAIHQIVDYYVSDGAVFHRFGSEERIMGMNNYYFDWASFRVFLASFLLVVLAWTVGTMFGVL